MGGLVASAGDVEAQLLGGRSEGTCPRSLGSKWGSWDLNMEGMSVLP